MDEHLVGYVLNSLDTETIRDMEEYLRAHPEAQQRVTHLRRILAPLESDRADPPPPAGLATRTIARLAAQQCQDMPAVPRIVALRRDAPPPRWWQRSDFFVAASILFFVVMLIPPTLTRMRNEEQKILCQNNLFQMGQGLLRYSDLDSYARNPDHVRGAYPHMVNYKAPYNTAGMFVPTLIDAGALSRDAISVRCPSVGPKEAPQRTLDDLMAIPASRFEQEAPKIVPSYAYSLGHRNARGQIVGPRRDDSVRPLVADLPPLKGEAPVVNGGNSVNHGGNGQNVLFTDGHLRYVTTRAHLGDDIYTNDRHEQAAGCHPGDNVLGHSGARSQPMSPVQE